MTERILILDFGSQVTQLIARRVREAGVYCEVIPFNADTQRIADFGAKGVILSGSPHSVTTTDGPRAPDIVWEMQVPVLGICYGQQTMCAQLGGEVAGSDHREFGRAELNVTAQAIYDLRSQGRGPAGFRVGRCLRFRRSVIQAWLERLEHEDAERHCGDGA